MSGTGKPRQSGDSSDEWDSIDREWEGPTLASASVPGAATPGTPAPSAPAASPAKKDGAVKDRGPKAPSAPSKSGPGEARDPSDELLPTHNTQLDAEAGTSEAEAEWDSDKDTVRSLGLRDLQRDLPVAPPSERRLARTIMGVGTPEVPEVQSVQSLFEARLKGASTSLTPASMTPAKTPAKSTPAKSEPPVALPVRRGEEAVSGKDKSSPSKGGPARPPTPSQPSAPKNAPASRPAAHNLPPLDIDMQSDTNPSAPEYESAAERAFVEARTQVGPANSQAFTKTAPMPVTEVDEPVAIPPTAPTVETVPPRVDVILPSPLRPQVSPPRPVPPTPGRGSPAPASPTRQSGPSNWVLIALWVVAVLSVGLAIFLYIR